MTKVNSTLDPRYISDKFADGKRPDSRIARGKLFRDRPLSQYDSPRDRRFDAYVNKLMSLDKK